VQRAFAEQNELGKAFLLYRAHPTFRKRIQIRTSWRKLETADPLRGEYFLEGDAELAHDVLTVSGMLIVLAAMARSGSRATLLE
jgi:hypothetical protein